MIDWHCHILPGVDDGAPDTEQALAMAAALAAAGFTTVYCTPHLMRGCYEASNDDVIRGVEVLQHQLNHHNIPLNLVPGREYCLDEYLLESLKAPITMGNNRQVLIEILPHTTVEMVKILLFDVVRQGFVPIIAHPERCPLLSLPNHSSGKSGVIQIIKAMFLSEQPSRRNPDPSYTTGNTLLDYLRDLGCRFQGNLGSLNGFYGSQVRTIALRMKECALYDYFGTDLHGPDQADSIFRGLDKL